MEGSAFEIDCTFILYFTSSLPKMKSSKNSMQLWWLEANFHFGAEDGWGQLKAPCIFSQESYHESLTHNGFPLCVSDPLSHVL